MIENILFDIVNAFMMILLAKQYKLFPRFINSVLNRRNLFFVSHDVEKNTSITEETSNK